MKKKTGMLITSAAAIAVCSSLIAGSTYALFTSESKVDVSVTAGDVNVTAYAQNLKLSYDENVVTGNLVDAKLEGNAVTLNGMTAGEKVEFEIVVTNKSTVPVKYRTRLENDGSEALMTALAFTVDEKDFSGLIKYTSDWTTLTNPGEVATVNVAIELPDFEGVEKVMGLSTKITYSVEAVQGNAIVKDEAETILSKVNTPAAMTKTLDFVKENGGTVVLTDDLVMPATSSLADIGTKEGITDGSKLNNRNIFTKPTVIDLNGHTLTTDERYNVESATTLTIKNGTFVSNMYYTANSSVSASNGAKVTLDNVRLTTTGSGVFPAGTATEVNIINGSYIEAVGVNGMCVATNAGSAENFNVAINIKDSTLKAVGNGVLMNVPGTLNMDNVTVESGLQAVIIRSGVANIANCTLTSSMDKATLEEEAAIYTAHMQAAYPDKTPAYTFGGLYNYINTVYVEGKDGTNVLWGAGNATTIATLVVGNKDNAPHRQVPASCTLTNTTVTNSGELGDAIYAIGNADPANGASVTYEQGNVTGNVVKGNANVKMTVVVTDTAEAQAALDNAYDNTTVYLKANNYDKLLFQQSAKHSVNMDRTLTPWNHIWLQRSIDGLTLTGEEGAVVNGFSFGGNLYNPDGGSTTLNPLTGKLECFYANYIVKNLEISNLTFVDSINIDVYYYTSKVYGSLLDGVKIINCKTTEDTDHMNEKVPTDKLANIVGAQNVEISGCTVTNRGQGFHFQFTENISVTGCKLYNLNHNAVGIQAGCSGDIVISGNVVDGGKDRVIRFADFTEGSITVTNNVMTNAGDDKGEMFKASSIAADVTVVAEGNSWNGATDEEVSDSVVIWNKAQA